MGSPVRYCDIDCNWIRTDKHEIEEVVIFQHENENEVPGPPTTTVPPEGCTVDRQSEDDEDCVLTIKSRLPQYNFEISAIDVLCSARHMEVYSSSGEYLDTSRGMMVQQLEDCRLYCLQHSLEKPSNKCQLKIKSLQLPGRLWIHSIYISIVPGPVSAADGSSFPGSLTPGLDMERVKEMMGNVELSAGAQQLLQSVETHTKKTQEAASPFANMGMMMQMFSQMATQGSQRGQGSTQRSNEGQGPTPRSNEGQGSTQRSNEGEGSTRSSEDSHGTMQRSQEGQGTTQGSNEGQGSTQGSNRDEAASSQENQTSEEEISDKIEKVSGSNIGKEASNSNNGQDNSEDVIGNEESTVARVSSLHDLGDTAKMLDEMLNKKFQAMEKRLVERFEEMVKDSERRICDRIEQIVINKLQGDTLGLD